MAPKKTPIPERIARNSAPADDRGCVEWTGWKSRGYGRMNIDGRKRAVHRVAWELVNGPVPDGKILDHSCANRACINVGHLRVATYSENNSHLYGPKSDNTHGHRNLYWDAGKQRWRALVTKDGRRYRFGSHRSLEGAVRAVEAGRAEVFGPYAGAA